MRAKRWCPASARCAHCAWAGVRPLYEEGASSEGREAKRTFAVLDYAARDGVGGLVTVVGGKFTTYRLMAERPLMRCARNLALTAPCVTRSSCCPMYAFRSIRRSRTAWVIGWKISKKAAPRIN